MSGPRVPADTPDARDTRDPALDAAWRTHLRDEPPPALDDAILAAAHRAMGSAPHSVASMARWRVWVPLATAATLAVLAFGIVELLPREANTPAVTSDVPAGAVTAPPAGVESKAVDDAAPATPRDEASVAPPVARPAPAASAPPSPARAQPPMESKRRRTEESHGVIGGMEVRPQPEAFPRQEAPAREPAAARPDAPSVMRSPAPAASARGDGAGVATMRDRASPERAARTARDYVDEISRLRAEGDEQAAIGALHAFRAAYADADARLPQPLRQWAAGVPR